MVTFITDIQGNEPDILTPVKHGKLKIFITRINSNKEEELLLEKEAPTNGWTDELLWNVNNEIIELTQEGDVLEAYVSSQWVGSSEV